MAGTLTISTLSDGTNSTSSTNCIRGSAKAWVNFNGQSSGAIRASYNVSSVTYNGTGNYTGNFTTAMTDANFAAPIMYSNSNNLAGGRVYDQTASSISFNNSSSSNTLVDGFYMGIAVFR